MILHQGKAGIQVAFVYELLMRAFGHHLPLVEHNYAVGPLHGCQTVGNDQHGAIMANGVQCLLEQTLAFRIKAGSGLVKKKQLLLFDQCRSEEYTSTLMY